MIRKKTDRDEQKKTIWINIILWAIIVSSILLYIIAPPDPYNILKGFAQTQEASDLIDTTDYKPKYTILRDYTYKTELPRHDVVTTLITFTEKLSRTQFENNFCHVINLLKNEYGKNGDKPYYIRIKALLDDKDKYRYGPWLAAECIYGACGSPTLEPEDVEPKDYRLYSSYFSYDYDAERYINEYRKYRDALIDKKKPGHQSETPKSNGLLSGQKRQQQAER